MDYDYSNTIRKEQIELVPATRQELNAAAATYHYMHRPVHARACPFGWWVQFEGSTKMPDDKPCGFIMFASIHFTKLKLPCEHCARLSKPRTGCRSCTPVFGYPDTPTKWQVLSLARLWCHDDLPKMSETCVIGKAHKLVQERWLQVHPPKFIDQPYHVRKIISFADNEYHEGNIYKAANYVQSGTTISKRRHKGTRGAGMDGHQLTRYIFTLPDPRWGVPMQSEMFGRETDYSAVKLPLVPALSA